MSRWKSILLYFLIISMVGFSAASVGVAAEKVLKLGVLGPFTGPAADVGNEFRGSTEMALENIGHKIGDYKVEVVWIDSQSDPAKATSAYSEAAERGGIQLGVLNWHSTVSLACIPVVAKYKVPHFFTFGGTKLINEKVLSDPKKFGYWGPKGWPTPEALVKGYVDCLNNAVEKGLWKPANKLVAIYGENTDWGKSVGPALRAAFAAGGWEISSEDYFSDHETDFYPLMAKYKKAGVSVIAGTSSNPPTITGFIKQADEVGVKAIIVAEGLGWVGGWYEMTGPASNHVIDMIPKLTTQHAKEWASAFEKKHGFKPSPSSGGLAYDGINCSIKLARRTLEKHQSLTKETIYDVMANELATGKLTFSADDGAIIMKNYKWTKESMPDPVVGPEGFFFPVIQYMKGEERVVYPEAWKEADFEAK